MISIITPLHHKGNPYILKGWQSLASQTNPDFEWIVLVNNGGDASSLPVDKRIKIFHFDGESRIGLLKREACLYATGSVILELDADDSLEETALAKIVDAFQNPEVMFVYSDCLEIDEDTNTLKTFSPYYGWKHNKIIIDGKLLQYNATFPVSPASLRQIYWAPNHLRAWRTSAYKALGGHNQELAIGDDHELMVRFYAQYGAKGFFHIEEPLYFYTLHKDNTFKEKARAIALQSWNNYHIYKEQMVLRWAEDNNLLAIDLGGGINPRTGYKTADLRENADYIMDLDGQWQWQENSVGVFRAADTLEHLKNPVAVMNKAYDALAPGGWFFIAVPSTDGRGAFQDPTHISFWNENSFWYYTDPKYAKYIPEFTGKFQVAQLRTNYPSDWHKQHNIPYVFADLIAVKPGYHPIGECLWRS